MKHPCLASMLAATASMLIAGCAEKRVVTALPIPPERMDCAPAGKRPAIPPEHAISWERVESALTVPDAVSAARAEVQQFIGSVRTREGTVAGYVISIEGALFACSSDAQWLREWQAGLAD